MILDMILAVIAALVLSLGLTRAMLALAPRLGLMDQPGERRIHLSPIPRAGGIAIWLTFLIVTVIGLLFGWEEYGGSMGLSWLTAFAAGSTILIAIGIVDDRRGLPALLKLGAHALAPLVFILLHPIKSGFFPPGWHPVFDIILFVVWSVVLINAFNLIDGLDGLCGGLAAMASFSLAGIALLNGRPDAALLLFIMGGAIVGFLRYNLNPARIFLGDAGSMLMGFFLATAATDAVGRKAVVGIILLPIAVAGVPLLDVLLAIWRRGARRVAAQLRGEGGRTGLFHPDRDHLHHRLLESAGSQHRVAVVLHGIAIVLSILAFLPMILGDRVIGLSIVGIIVVLMAGMRHLARVEMEQMGNVVHLAIKLPGGRRRLAAALFFYDVFALTAAGAAAVIIETNRLTLRAELESQWVFMVIYASVATFGMLMARVHRRLWVRATMRDLISLNCWLLLAGAVTFIVYCAAKGEIAWSILRLTMIAHVCASFAVSAPRAVLDLIRDFSLEARNRRGAPPPPGSPFGPAVILGAGDLGTLAIDHLKSSYHDDYPGLRVLGFLDDNRMLHGRRLRSFPIFGSIEMIPKLVEKDGLRTLILAVHDPKPAFLEKIHALAATHQLTICHWDPRFSPSNAPTAEP
jgi:UDP-N-acetylmuramyl pentapeptide phosphotransferase/UDP-N-acetylglucosamine-1-phosphate transferase